MCVLVHYVFVAYTHLVIIFCVSSPLSPRFLFSSLLLSCWASGAKVNSLKSSFLIHSFTQPSLYASFLFRHVVVFHRWTSFFFFFYYVLYLKNNICSLYLSTYPVSAFSSIGLFLFRFLHLSHNLSLNFSNSFSCVLTERTPLFSPSFLWYYFYWSSTLGTRSWINVDNRR